MSGDSGDRLRMLLCLGHHFRPGKPWCPNAKTPPADLRRPTPPPDGGGCAADDDEVPTVLQLGEYNGEDEGCWVLLEPVAEA